MKMERGLFRHTVHALGIQHDLETPASPSLILLRGSGTEYGVWSLWTLTQAAIWDIRRFNHFDQRLVRTFMSTTRGLGIHHYCATSL